jgi:pyruvate kinase
MDVARLNMSHGDYADHLTNLQNVRNAAAAAGRPVGVLADLQGPKIRLGRFVAGKERLAEGARFAITTEDIKARRALLGHVQHAEDVRPGDAILIDDGGSAWAIEVTDTDVITEVVSGPISNLGDQPARRRGRRAAIVIRTPKTYAGRCAAAST